MATKYEVEFWKEQCRRLTAALDLSREDKHALTARIMDNSEEVKTVKAIMDGLEWQVSELEEENAKLRELVGDMHEMLELFSEHAPMGEFAMSAVEADMRELGIEV